MANEAAWNEGWQQGRELSQERRARKQMLSDEDRQQKASDLIDTRNSILIKLPTLLGPKGEKTPEYDDAYQKLTQAQTDLGELYPPIHDTSAIQKDWHFLLEKMHGITAPKDVKNTPLSWKDRGQYQSPKELKQKAEAMQAAQREAGLLVAGAPLSPQQKAQANATQQWALVDAYMKIWDQHNPNAPKEDRDAVKAQLYEKYIGTTGKGNWETVNGTIADPTDPKKRIPVSYFFDKTGGRYANPDQTPVDPNVARTFIPDPKASGVAGEELKEYYADTDPNKGTFAKWKAKQTAKSTRGTLLNTKKYGWIQTWVDPTNPSKIVGWQKTTPSRYYQGTQTSGTTTDSAGVTTSSSHITKPTDTAPIDIDLTGAEELPDASSEAGAADAPVPTQKTPSGSSNKSSAAVSSPPASTSTPTTKASPSKGVAKPSELKKQIPAPPPQASTPSTAYMQTDAQGHIPENAVGPDGKKLNPLIREAANQLMDGVDMKDISLPVKDKPVAEAAARRYGWGRGPYLPRELKQMQNAKQFLDQALHSKAFMAAIDNGFFRKFQTAEAEHDASKSGFVDTAIHVLSINHLTPEQQQYLTIRQALMGTVSGLSSVVRTGRPTEATINRLAQEIPDVMSSANSKMAKEKIKQIEKELNLALTQGVPPPRPKNTGGGLSLADFKEKHHLE